MNTTKLDYSVPALARMSWPVFIELLLQLLDGKQPEQRVVRIPAALTIRQSHGL